MKEKKIKTIKGQKIYSKAKKIIPGGNMLLSKRPEFFLPKGWPTYFEKTKGCEVWDVDKNKYFDLSLMGVGTNILGYSNKKVDNAVFKTIKKGNLSTLNCYEEVFLAERLVELHPWAHMVKFARTGGEANAMAIRIARAASGKDNVAFCGYHGWHDWYLATNINKDKNLNEHLLKNMPISGVPLNLANSVFPFKFNDYNKLEKLVSEKNIGVICMEVMRNEEPKNFFLQKIRKLADKKGIVLIFDECTSAFRKTYGGLHKLFGVNPDIALFGKALGNGYSITAVIGRKNIMENAQKSFISSTFWTERIGPSAALATLEEMKRIKSWETIDRCGKNIIKGWKKLEKKYELKIEISGLPALCSFKFLNRNNQKYKTLITQEMLKNGFLASNTVYSSVAHSQEIINRYFYELDKVFKLIQMCENGYNIDKILKFPVSIQGFQRIN
jgi:glutamate-1-semialdehyde 2,1-aminomutase